MPLNFHIGNMGLASYYPETVDSVPPAIHGGNVDDRRIGKGATMYYPVQVRLTWILYPNCRNFYCHCSIDVPRKDLRMLHHPHQRVSNACSTTQHTSTIAVPSKVMHLRTLHHAHHGVVCVYCVERVECSTSMHCSARYVLLRCKRRLTVLLMRPPKGSSRYMHECQTCRQD